MRILRRLLTVVLCLLLLGGAAGYWFLLRDTSAAQLALRNDRSLAAGRPVADLGGTWKIVAGRGEEATVAGYRVKEKLVGGIAKTTATGRTTHVAGSIRVVGSKVTAARVTVDMTTLHSDKAGRDAALETHGVETGKYPTATFTLTEPVALPQLTRGKVATARAHGALTLHGVTKSVSVPVNLKLTGTTAVVQAALPIAMADYAMTPPSIRGIVSVDDHGSLEMLLSLSRARHPRSTDS
jgi:polyisoprenoid-binding protein YceI